MKEAEKKTYLQVRKKKSKLAVIGRKKVDG